MINFGNDNRNNPQSLEINIVEKYFNNLFLKHLRNLEIIKETNRNIVKDLEGYKLHDYDFNLRGKSQLEVTENISQEQFVEYFFCPEKEDILINEKVKITAKEIEGIKEVLKVTISNIEDETFTQQLIQIISNKQYNGIPFFLKLNEIIIKNCSRDFLSTLPWLKQNLININKLSLEDCKKEVTECALRTLSSLAKLKNSEDPFHKEKLSIPLAFLSLSNCNLIFGNLPILFSILNSIPILVLNLSDNQLDDKFAKLFYYFLSNDKRRTETKLRTVILKGNKITDKGFSDLIKLAGIITDCINFQQNLLTENVFEIIGTEFGSNRQIKEESYTRLDLTDNNNIKSYSGYKLIQELNQKVTVSLTNDPDKLDQSKMFKISKKYPHIKFE